MLLDTEKIRCMLMNSNVKYVGSKYKIDEEDERPINETWPKDTQYIRTPERNGKAFNYSEYCKKDVEMTRKVTSKMSKIKRTNDSRMNYNTGNIYVVIGGKAYIPESVSMRTGFREAMEYEFSITTDPNHTVENTMLAIKNVIFNPPATIVFWGDGSKTVVKCQDGEEYDPEKGLTMAFFKRMHDNKGHYFEEIKKWTNKYAMSLFKDEVYAVKDEQIMKAVEVGMSESKSDKETEDSVRWEIFYARVDRGENEGYIRHAIVYKHKSSATRAAKRLISKLPAGVMYEWYVDSIDKADN